MQSLLRIIAGVVIGLLLIFIVVRGEPIVRGNLPSQAVLYPLPHQISKYPGGVSFRFAMVHDVIHDRYPRHGKAYYQERNRRVLAAIEKNKDAEGLPPPEQLHLIDDLGVGLDVLGNSDEAARWMFLKLKAEEKRGLTGKDLYVSYANLGTFIIHGAMAKALQGDKAAQEWVRVGVDYLKKGIAVYPEAHFGREIWQVVAAEFMLKVAEDRRVLLEFDVVGNMLSRERYATPKPGALAMRSNMDYSHSDIARRVNDFLKAPGSADQREHLRHRIQHAGGEWGSVFTTSLTQPVPFDEPCLGIIGLWRLGGGASPHFALALGDTMMRVQQRHLAWSAYQRAILEANRFTSDDAIRAKLIEHCKARQQAIQFEDEERAQLASSFDAELRIGQSYQHAYQQYEAEQIAAGKDLDDPHFYDAFHAIHGNIATPVGDADFLEVKEVTWEAIAWTVFIIGAAVFLIALNQFLWVRRKRAKASQASGHLPSET